ncbi:MAG TPA: nucleotidyltransferase family protein [Acidimicrobiales bacterium]|nr:nucleotidyltransferase family protein [Acidimicrobiales bacterium]
MQPRTATLSAPADELASRLKALVRSSPVLMRALRAARAVDPPGWLIGAGVIRDRVWDHLHGFTPVPSRDVDLAFFDSLALESERERSIQREVTAQAPDISWDVTNYAGVHLWYPEVFGIEIEPLTSCADAVATWPETATAIGVRLLADNSVRVVAPYGLGDLFGLICRRNPRCVTEERYLRRVERLQIAKRWPRVQIIDAPE